MYSLSVYPIEKCSFTSEHLILPFIQFFHWISKHFNHGIALILSLTILLNALFFQHFLMFICSTLDALFWIILFIRIFPSDPFMIKSHWLNRKHIHTYVRSSLTFIHMLNVFSAQRSPVGLKISSARFNLRLMIHFRL